MTALLRSERLMTLVLVVAVLHLTGVVGSGSH
jgi:hypothetical protein